MTRSDAFGAALFVAGVTAVLFYAGTRPGPDMYAVQHERLAQERRHGEALAMQSLCRSYRQNVTNGDSMLMGGC